MDKNLLNEVVFALLKHGEGDLASRVVQSNVSLEELVVGKKAGAKNSPTRRKWTPTQRKAASEAQKKRWAIRKKEAKG